jgi:transcriptional regulator with XRE-family HTH domain
MDRLKNRLGVDPDSRDMKRAKTLASNDLELLANLVDLRKQQNISQTDLAEKLGLTQATIAAFERTDNDPKLSTIRRYAHGVGALVVHRVALDEGQLMADECSEWDAAALRRSKTRVAAPVGYQFPKQIQYLLTSEPFFTCTSAAESRQTDFATVA